jgi:predicted LPLAT superfamily acyltransferase
MSSEWVAPTATAIVGLAGIAATWLTARSGRRDQQTLFEKQHQEAKEAALREAHRHSFAALSGTITGSTNLSGAVGSLCD